MKFLIIILLILVSQNSFAGGGSYLCKFEDGPYENQFIYKYSDEYMYKLCKTSNANYQQRLYEKCTSNTTCLHERERHERLEKIVIFILSTLLFFTLVFIFNESFKL